MNKLFLASIILILFFSNIFAKEVSTYKYATIQNSNSVKNTLKNNGFTIVGEYDAMQDPDYHIIAFTNDTMKADASKKEKGFAGIQKVLIDKTDNMLVFTNPEYFLHAYLQDDFNKKSAQMINAKLRTAFGEMTGSADALDEDDLQGYHFMFGMPYYEDMIEIAQGEGLADKIRDNAGKNLVFELQLKSATLFGIAMPTKNGEASYIHKIGGEKNSAFLPYMVLVEENKAKILHPKYALAIAYPKLSMGDFMSISSTPDDIENYIKSLVPKP